MARIAGVDLPRDKRVVIGLTYIYGIGRTTSAEILRKLDISESIRIRDLSSGWHRRAQQTGRKSRRRSPDSVEDSHDPAPRLLS